MDRGGFLPFRRISSGTSVRSFLSRASNLFEFGHEAADVVAGSDPDTGFVVPESVYDAFACHEAVIPLV